MKLKYYIFILLLLFTTNTVWATNAVYKKVTLDESIAIAVEKNLDINNRRKDCQIATNKIKIANRLQNPELQTLFMMGDTSLGNPQQLGLALPIEIMKRGPRKNLAIAEKKLTTESVSNDVFKLKMEVRTAYISYASSKSILKIIEKQQSYLKEMVAIASKRVFVGVAPEVEYMQAKLILDQLKTVYNLAVAQVEIEQYNFNKTLNVDEDALIYDIVDSELPQNQDFIKLSTPNPKSRLPCHEEVEKIALEHRNDIDIAEYELEIAKKNLIVVIKKNVPDVTAVGGFMFLTDWQNNDFKISNGGPLYGAYAGLMIDLPILYRYKPEIQNAKLEVEKKEIHLQSVKNVAKEKIKIAHTNLLVAQKNLNYYSDELLNNSSNVVQSSKRSYEEGKTELTNLILMQQANTNILMGYTISLENYYYAWIDFLRELGIECVN